MDLCSYNFGHHCNIVQQRDTYEALTIMAAPGTALQNFCFTFLSLRKYIRNIAERCVMCLVGITHMQTQTCENMRKYISRNIMSVTKKRSSIKGKIQSNLRSLLYGFACRFSVPIAFILICICAVYHFSCIQGGLLRNKLLYTTNNFTLGWNMFIIS